MKSFEFISEAKKAVPQNPEIINWFTSRFMDDNNNPLTEKNVVMNNDGSVNIKVHHRKSIYKLDGVRFDEIPYKINEIKCMGFMLDGISLKSLKNLPDKCNFGLYLMNNNLETLTDLPQMADYASVYLNKNPLKSLSGSPSIIREMSVTNCGLNSLEGSPDKVHEYFECGDNNLTSLLGAPKSVGHLVAVGNPLKSLDGLPQELYGINLTYSPNLPLLKLFLVDKIRNIQITESDNDGNYHPLSHIMTNLLRNFGSVNPQQKILIAKRELIKAGYEGNARL